MPRSRKINFLPSIQLRCPRSHTGDGRRLEGGIVPKGNLDTLSPEDFRAAWDALPKADKARVGLIAREWTSGTSFEWQELLNEAIVRALAGTRKCPREISPVLFLAQTMRSIRSEWRNKWLREHDRTSDNPAANGIDRLSEENKRDVENAIARVLAYLSGDDDALKYLTGLLDGWTRRECMERFHWTKTHFETVRRRFNNKMARLGEQLRAPPPAEEAAQ
jgi:hypothetical protein